ncbi:MAG: rhomboid family intramembrane serine protease [bacterium]|nr:rhomboid family intramembrane serine protease [bacterium]
MKNQRQAILCPNCRKLISTSESKCPFCGTRKPGSWFKNNAWTRGFRDPNRMIIMIIALNVGMFIISILLNPRAAGLAPNPLTFLSPSGQNLEWLGATGRVPIGEYHRYWTLVAASYLHGGILHIFFNMIAFRQLAVVVTREFGIYRMFAIYTLSGVAGFWISYLFNVYWTIGASAAVCGLVGALLYYGKSRGGLYGKVLYKQISMWVVFLFVFGFVVPGINNWGHGGGLLAGICLGFLLGYREKRRENIFHKLLAGSCVLATLVVLAWAVARTLFFKMMG